MLRARGEAERKPGGCMACTVAVGGPRVCELPGKQVEKANVI